MARTRTGLFVIRAWVEPGSSLPLRAQVRSTTDVSFGIERSLTLAHMDAVVETLQGWLSEMLAGSDAAGDDSESP
jgi:hypothetical protein